MNARAHTNTIVTGVASSTHTRAHTNTHTQTSSIPLVNNFLLPTIYIDFWKHSNSITNLISKLTNVVVNLFSREVFTLQKLLG